MRRGCVGPRAGNPSAVVTPLSSQSAANGFGVDFPRWRGFSTGQTWPAISVCKARHPRRKNFQKPACVKSPLSRLTDLEKPPTRPPRRDGPGRKRDSLPTHGRWAAPLTTSRRRERLAAGSALRPSALFGVLLDGCKLGRAFGLATLPANAGQISPHGWRGVALGVHRCLSFADFILGGARAATRTARASRIDLA